MNHFKEMGYFSYTTFGCLTTFTDNCVGKNEKKITICFIILLSEIGLLSFVTLLFCIQRYTGNAADLLLNLLKDEYHKKDIFTYE